MLTLVPKTNDIYVPAAQQRAAKPLRRLPTAMARLSTIDAFRGVAWTGTERLDEPAAPRPAMPWTRALRHVLADIPWSGSAPAAPTPAQEAGSVHAFVHSFRWD